MCSMPGAKIVGVVIHGDRSRECAKGEARGGRWPVSGCWKGHASCLLYAAKPSPHPVGHKGLCPRVGVLQMVIGKVAVGPASSPEMSLKAPLQARLSPLPDTLQ